MKLGIPLPAADDPDAGLRWAQDHGFGAVYVEERWCGDESLARAHGQRIRDSGLVAAELGIWCNPMDPDPLARATAHERCVRLLALADAVEARCCVNILGSVGTKWDGPCAQDLTQDTFDQAVETVRSIVDAVNPRRTYYTLETMPWMFPDSTESYVQLLQAIDRPRVAVHFDPVNLIHSPGRYFNNAAVIRDFISQLGERIRSVHVKDVLLRDHLTVHLDECRPGLGGLDHAALMRSLAPLDADIPMLLEHLPTTEEYLLGASHLRRVATAHGFDIGQDRPDSVGCSRAHVE